MDISEGRHKGKQEERSGHTNRGRADQGGSLPLSERPWGYLCTSVLGQLTLVNIIAFLYPKLITRSGWSFRNKVKNMGHTKRFGTSIVQVLHKKHSQPPF